MRVHFDYLEEWGQINILLFQKNLCSFFFYFFNSFYFIFFHFQPFFSLSRFLPISLLELRLLLRRALSSRRPQILKHSRHRCRSPQSRSTGASPPQYVPYLSQCCWRCGRDKRAEPDVDAGTREVEKKKEKSGGEREEEKMDNKKKKKKRVRKE